MEHIKATYKGQEVTIIQFIGTGTEYVTAVFYYNKGLGLDSDYVQHFILGSVSKG